MLNVGFILLHPFHESPGSVIRVQELTRSLSKIGVRCHVCTPFSENDSWNGNAFFHRIPMTASELGLSDALYGLMRLSFNVPFIARNILLKKKTLDKMVNKLAKKIYDVVQKEELDVIQGEQELAAVACTRIKEKLGIPVVADLHNIWPEELIAINVIKKEEEQFEALHGIENEIVSNSDSIIAVSKEMKHYIQRNYNVSSKCVKVVPPGGRPRIHDLQEKPPPPKVVYAGLVTYREHVDLFVKSMPIISRKCADAEFYITNKGEKLGLIRKLAKRVRATPKYFWYPSKDDFFRFLASCYVGVLPSSNDIARKIGTPVKLFDYLSVGLPVVANDIGAWVNVIKSEEVGLVTEDDPHDFADGIIKLLNDPELVQAYGRKGLELVRTKYSWDKSANTLLTEYKHLTR